MSDELRYLIPRRIQQGFQFTAGWTPRRVAVVVGGALIGGVIGRVFHSLHASIYLQGGPFILLIGLAYGLVKPLPIGTTTLDWVLAWWRWRHKQRLWLFDRSRDDC